jgi:hypothetical protein
MSRYILIRRLRGPAILLLIGTLALLHQLGVIPYFWRFCWPLLLIVLGVLLLAERAALASEGYAQYPGAPWQGTNQGTNQWTNPGPPFQSTSNAAAPQTTSATAIVPSNPLEIEKYREGGQS